MPGKTSRLHLLFGEPTARNCKASMSQSLKACLLYTPDREHFGIVPVEAMYAARHMCRVCTPVASGCKLLTCTNLEPKAFGDRKTLYSAAFNSTLATWSLRPTEARVPVVAVNTGGPLESIVDGAACLPKKVHAFEL